MYFPVRLCSLNSYIVPYELPVCPILTRIHKTLYGFLLSPQLLFCSFLIGSGQKLCEPSAWFVAPS
jgi:hypothetical protein